MQFPQENYFKKSSSQSSSSYLQLVQHFMRGFMWSLVLLSLLVVSIAVSLALVWLILGAIVNPTAFLPIATSAGVFVTLVTSKYAEFNNILENGFDSILNYLKSKAESQFAGVVKKMDLKGKIKAAVSSDMLQTFAAQGAKLGLVKPDMIEQLQKNADKICQNPLKAAEEMSGELANIASDPGKYLKEQLEQLEERLWTKLEEEIKDKMSNGNMAHSIVKVIQALLSSDQDLMKKNLLDLFNSFINSISNVNIPVSTLNVVWNFIFLKDPKIRPVDLQLTIMRDLATTFAEILKQDNEIQDAVGLTENSIEKLFSIILAFQNQQENYIEQIINHFESIITDLAGKEEQKNKNQITGIFTNIKNNSFIFPLFKIAIHLTYQNKKNFPELRNLITQQFLPKFLSKITKKQISPQFIEFFDLCTQGLATSFEAIEFKKIKSICDATKVIISVGNQKQLKAIEPQFSLISSYFAFLRNQIHQIPEENIKSLLNSALLLEEESKNQIKVLCEIQKSDQDFTFLVEQIKYFNEAFIYFNEKPEQIKYQMVNNAGIYQITDSKTISQYSTIFCLKFPCFQSGLAEVQGFKILNILSKKLRITDEQIIGILAFAIQDYSFLEVQTVFDTMLKLAKISPSKKSIIMSLFYLLTSYDETLIYEGALTIGIPPKFVPLILIAKKIYEPKYITDLEWSDLGLDLSQEKILKLISNSSELNIESNSQEDKKKFNEWIKSMGQELLQSKSLNDVQGGDDNKTKMQLLNWKQYFAKEEFKECLQNLKNLKNTFAKLKQSEFDFIFNLQTLQNINTFSESAFDQNSKNTIINLSKLLNIEELLLDNMMSLFFLQAPQKVLTSLKFFCEDIPKNEQNYINYCLVQVQKISIRHKFIQDKMPRIFLDQNEQKMFPPELYSKLLLNPKEKLKSSTYFKLLEGLCEEKSYNDALIQAKPLISLIQSSMKSIHPLEIMKIFKFNSSGICTILLMANKSSAAQSRNEWLDYLKSLQLGRTYQIFLCLKAVFEGKSSGIEIKSKDGEILTCTRFLHLETGIPEEWFQMLPYLFTSNISEFVEQILKYLRRLEALNNPKVPAQSLVKINPKLVECLLQFIEGSVWFARVGNTLWFLLIKNYYAKDF